MSKFYLRYGVSVIPIEETTLSDGSTTVKNIDSNIGKAYGAEDEVQYSTSTGHIISGEFNVTSNVAASIDSFITALNNTDNVDWLFLKLKSGVEVEVGVGSGHINLHEPGFAFNICLTDSQGVNTTQASNITLATVVTGTATIEYLIIKNAY